MAESTVTISKKEYNYLKAVEKAIKEDAEPKFSSRFNKILNEIQKKIKEKNIPRDEWLKDKGARKKIYNEWFNQKK